MKKMLWLYSILGCVALVLLCKAGFAHAGEVSTFLKNAFNFSRLPQEYTDYRDINADTVYNFGDKTMKLAFTSDATIETWLNPSNELIVITQKIQGDSFSEVYQADVTTYKLDKSGKVIDQYQYRWDKHQQANREILFEGYAINPAQRYCHTWALNGNAAKQHITVLNEKLQWSRQQQIEQYRAIAAKLHFFTFFPSGNEATQVVFIEDGKCGILNINFYPEDGMIQSRGNTVNNVFRRYSAAEGEWTPIESANIRYRYFYREKAARVRSNLGGYDSWSTRATYYDVWLGALYTDVTIGASVLKIKENLTETPRDPNTVITIDGEPLGALNRSGSGLLMTPYLYYARPQLDFQLFTNVETRLFIIQDQAQASRH